MREFGTFLFEPPAVSKPSLVLHMLIPGARSPRANAVRAGLHARQPHCSLTLCEWLPLTCLSKVGTCDVLAFTAARTHTRLHDAH